MGGRGDPLRLRLRGRSAVPVGRGRLLPRLLPGLLRRACDARPAPARPSSARWSGSTASMAAIAAAALGSAVLFEVVLRHTDGSTRVIVTNLAYPLGDVLLLSAVVGVFALTGWRPDRTWGLIGAALAGRPRSPTGSSSSRPPTARTPRGRSSTRCGRRRCCCSAAAVWQQPRRADGPARRPAAARDLRRLRRDRPGDPRLRPLPPAQLLAVGLAAATLVAVAVRMALDVPREHAQSSSCIRTQAVTDALTGLGNRRRLMRRPRAGARRRRSGSAALARDLRPRRLQALQRHVRPSGRRRAARAARGGARRGRRAARGALPAGRRRVLRLSPTSPPSTRRRSSTTTARRPVESGWASRSTSSFGAVRAARGGRRPDRRPARSPTSACTPRSASARGLASGRTSAAPGARTSAPGPAGPCRRGAELARPRSARRSGCRGEELEELRLAARLHDVGKLAVPDDDPPEARPARPTTSGRSSAAHGDRRADPRRRPGLARRGRDRARHARALGRHGLPRRARRRRDPARPPASSPSATRSRR